MYRSCKTCRTRRRACDKQKPFCGNCTRLGRCCEGYEDGSEALFVNYDSQNVQGRKKRVLTDAIADLRRGAKVVSREHHEKYLKDQTVWKTQKSSYDSTLLFFANNSTLEYSITPDFSLHLQTLWNFFLTQNAIANEAWNLGFTPFVLTSRSFDLAILAMSAFRYGLVKEDAKMKTLSVAAYHKSLQMFRKQVEVPGCSRKQACMAVIAFALCLADAATLTPADIFSDVPTGSILHLQGAIVFIRQCGPAAFQTDGFHWIFKKVRELAAIMAMSNYEPSCFVEENWMTVPWAEHKKTLRDRLHDVFVLLTRLGADTLNPSFDPKSAYSSRIPSVRADLKELRSQLNAWQRAWESNERPGMSTYERTLFDAELLSLKLVCGLIDARTADDPDSALELCRILATSLRAMLRRPMFGSWNQVIRDAVEGQCRAVFPFWALSQYCLHDAQDLRLIHTGQGDVKAIDFVEYLHAVPPTTAKPETP